MTTTTKAAARHAGNKWRKWERQKHNNDKIKATLEDEARDHLIRRDTHGAEIATRTSSPTFPGEAVSAKPDK